MGSVKIISASAGSGKTYTLAYEYVKGVVADPGLYRHILAVTFTNKATEEMKSRILREVHLLASGQRSDYLEKLERDLGFPSEKIRLRAAEARKNILHDYSRFSVLTIDRFFQRLIRSFIRELGVEVNFNLELETDSLVSEAADALIEDISTDEKLRNRLFLVARDRMEDNKRWNVKEPLLGLGRELFGEEYQRAREEASESEETASLIEAIVEKAARVREEIVAKAAEASEMITHNGLSPADFKGKSASVAAYFSQVAAGDVKALTKYARAALESADGWVHPGSEFRGVAESLVPHLVPLLTDIDTLYNDNFRLMNSARLLRENYRNFLLLADLQQRVEEICREGNIMPISETNRMISRLVQGNDTPFIFEKAGSYYSRFMIDEFQDTSLLQWENFVPLLKNAIASEEGTPVMLIGDVKQAIYRWRGGDWRILSHRVREEMGEGRVEAETLAVNYRSMRRVVEFNNNVVGLAVEADNAELNLLVADGLSCGAIDAAEAASLKDLLKEAYSGHVQQPHSEMEEGYVTLTVYDANEDGEYIPPLVEKIEELQSRGYAPGDIAVLVRSNDQGTRVAQMLLERKHSDPNSSCSWDVVTQEALTVGSAAISRFIIACLSLAADRADTVSRAIYNNWSGRPFGEPLTADDTDFFDSLAAMSPEEAFEEIVLRYGLQGRTGDTAYIQAIHEQINTFSSRSVADIPLFLRWWNEKGMAASVTMQGGGAITVSTIHKSKGLQYRAVIIPWLSWTLSPGRGVVWAEPTAGELDGVGTIPINYREQMSDSFFAARWYREQILSHIDAMNIFYVAVTRAEQELHLMVPANPRAGKNTIGTVVRNVLGVVEPITVWGSPLFPAQAERVKNDAMTTYPTARPGAKIKLRMPSARYVEDAGVELTPRDFGVLMHRAFENAAGVDDVRRAADKMLADAVVSRAEYAHLQSVVERAFANPLVAGWFGGNWDAVRNENNIVVAGDPSVRRPDRVMVRGARAVVVDYKFGRRIAPEHTAQLETYMELLRGMGYAYVEGYLWYVSLDRIEKM
jgi:ATP-dependent exoDNAse (exonuclease V) beta subunit